MSIFSINQQTIIKLVMILKILEFGPEKVLTGLNKRILSEHPFSAVNSLQLYKKF